MYLYNKMFFRDVNESLIFLQVPMPMVYNAEEIMGSDGEGMVAIGMVEEDENEDVQHHQVGLL